MDPFLAALSFGWEKVNLSLSVGICKKNIYIQLEGVFRVAAGINALYCQYAKSRSMIPCYTYKLL